MEKQKRLSEDLLEGIIPEEEPIMNFQPVVKLDKFGKKKIDRTIVLTTHYLEEAEELCDEIAIINQGSLIVHDEKHHLMNKIDLFLTPEDFVYILI